MMSCGDAIAGMRVVKPRQKVKERARRGSCWRVGWLGLSVGGARESETCFPSLSLSQAPPFFSEGRAATDSASAPLLNLPPLGLAASPST